MVRPLALLLVACALAGCAQGPRAAGGAQAAGVAARAIPADPKARAEIVLGFRLFFEPKLSRNDKMSCAQCHKPVKGFSNGEPTAAGVAGVRGTRNVPTIYGAARSPAQFWDGRAATLEAQALGPIENPVEMDAKLADVTAKLEAHPYYHAKFREVYGKAPDAEGIARAIAAFERAVELGAAPVDTGAMTEQQARGAAIFAGKGNCKSCHTGPDFTDGAFHSTGVGLDGPKPDVGRFAHDPRPAMYGAFKTPTLRNVALTAPYMHDGSIATLRAVVERYDRGGGEAKPLGLTAGERADLTAFLEGALGSGDNLKALAKLPGIKN